MLKRTRVSAGLTLAIAGGMFAAASPSLAQQQVEVTGSRIARPNLEGSTPVMSVNKETLGNLGLTNFADLATQLPQFTPSFGSSRTQSTFSGVETSGLQRTNLRNLGSQSTLTLINGRRVPGGTSTSGGVDFNSIPFANIERIETITGGSSAIYGADAMAGVVNIITKKNFQGVEVGVQYGETSAGDNKSTQAHIMMGGRLGDAGRALLTMEFHKDGHVSCADREFCNDDIFWPAPDDFRKGPRARSGVPLAGRFFPGDGKSYTQRNGSFTDANGALIPFATAIDGYNRNAQRDLAIPTKRVVMAGDVEYTLGKNVTAFGEFNFASTSINSKFEGNPFQSHTNKIGGVTEATIPLNNPFIPAALRAAMVANRATEMTWWQRFSADTVGGNRGATSDRDMVRTVFGVKGEFESLMGLGTDWQWEATHTYGRTTVNLGTDGSVGVDKLYEGLRVEETAPGSGKYQCVSATARALGCVPVNPFAGKYTPEMSKYLVQQTSSNGKQSINDSIVSLTGSPFKLPAGPVRTVLGAEYRTLYGGLDHDTQINLGTVTGNKISDTDYVNIKTQEVFGEILVPLLANKPFIKLLNAEGAYRHSTSASKSYDTWSFGGEWEPTDGLRFRAKKARSVRTPSPGELSGIGQTFGVVNDPCTASRRNANPIRAVNCATDGVPADYNPGQIIEQSVEGLSGGNANLNPEVGTTLTYGLVFTPKMLSGFSLAIDRFTIKVKDQIATVDRGTAINLCYDTPNRLLCESKTRGTHPLLPGATYVLKSVNEQLQNVASLDISGVDIDASYSFKTSRFGDFNVGALATVYDKATFVPLVGEDPVELLGSAGGTTILQGYIRFTASANVGWKMGAFKANWNLRHVGNADMGVGSATAGFAQIGSHTYHNVRVSYGASKGVELYAGVTNLFDKKPPIFASGYSGTQALDTIPGYYDVFGRSVFMGATAKF